MIGIDLGTTACKTIIFDENGQEIVKSLKEYPLETPKSGWAEQDPNKWWMVTVSTLKEANQKAHVDPNNISAIGLTGQQSSTVFLNSNGKVLCPSILWMDRRTTPQCDFIKKAIGEDRIYELTALRIDPMYSVSKILWVRENMPNVFNSTYKIILPKDYIAYKLTGNILVDYTNASATQLLDIKKKEWSDELLDSLDIPREILPDLCSSTDVVGGTTKEISDDVGLNEGTPVISGGGDVACPAIGAGVVVPSRTCVSIGTCSDVIICSDKPALDPKKRVGYYPHAILDKYILIAGANTGGVALRWFKDYFGSSESKRAQSLKVSPYEIMDREAEMTKPGAAGLIFLPYLMGERSPIYDPIARGAFFGITLRHQKAHFIRAIMEGVAFSIKHRLDIAEELGTKISDIRITGGGAKSSLWRQIIADVTNKPVIVLSTGENTCMGAAILAGVGVGVYRSVKKACDRILTVIDRNEPRATFYGSYSELFKAYKKLYESTTSSLNILTKFT